MVQAWRQVPATFLHYRWPDLPGPQIEERMEAKKQAVYAFAQACGLVNDHMVGCPSREACAAEAAAVIEHFS